MSVDLPAVGEAGPGYATKINAAITEIDAGLAQEITDRQDADAAIIAGAVRSAATVDARFFGIYSWETTVGCNVTSGSPLVTNSVSPFAQDDVGKIVIVTNTGDTLKFMATILSVDGSAVATVDANAPFTTTNNRVTWGFDQSDLINDALAFLSSISDLAPTRLLNLGHGTFRATQIVVAPWTGIVGQGWGNGGVQSGSTALRENTLLKQLAGANVDFITFTEAFSLDSTTGYCSPFHIDNFVAEGPEINVVDHPVTAGSGISYTNAAGKKLLLQDGCFTYRILSTYWYDDGFYMPEMGPTPITLIDCSAFVNGRYGANCADGNPQAIHFLNFSGDQNSEGLIRVANLPAWSSVTITALKSEMAYTVYNPTGVSNYQQNAVVLDNCQGHVVINGITHVSALPDPVGVPHNPSVDTVFQAPGAAIKIVATDADKIPLLTWSGVGVRDHSTIAGSTETGGPGPVLEDTHNGVTVPQGVSSGTYGFQRNVAHPRTGGGELSTWVFGGDGTYHGPTFPSPVLQAQGYTPSWSWYESDGAADRKYALAVLSTGEWSLRFYDDAGTLIDKAIAVTPGGGPVTIARQLDLSASTTTRASLNVPHGTAPSTPVDGDVWTTTAGTFVRINGATVGPLASLASPAFTGNPTAPTASPGDADTSIATTGFVAAAVTAATLGLFDDRGGYDASGNTFPSSGGSGSAGAVLKGDVWTITVAGTLGGTAVVAGDLVRALVDAPGQTAGNWSIAEHNLGYVPENITNKDTDGTLAANSDTKYASQKATKTYSDTKIAKTLVDANTVIGGLVDDTPIALTVAQLRTLLAIDDPSLLTVGQETFPRRDIVSSFGLSNQNFRFVCFTARKTETTTQVRVPCQIGYSGTPPTVIRFGLYSIDGSGNLTLVASTANDTSLLAAQGAYTKAWQASFAMVAGTRYAFGALVVTAGTGPTIQGNNPGNGLTAEFGLAPRMSGVFGGQTDLPSSVTVTSSNDAAIMPYAVILP